MQAYRDEALYQSLGCRLRLWLPCERIHWRGKVNLRQGRQIHLASRGPVHKGTRKGKICAGDCDNFLDSVRERHGPLMIIAVEEVNLEDSAANVFLLEGLVVDVQALVIQQVFDGVFVSFEPKDVQLRDVGRHGVDP